MGLVDREARFVVSERVEEADALGCPEDEVEPGVGSKLTLLGPPLSGLSVDPLDGDRPCLRVLS